jgi:hypothetical protein
MACCGGSRTSPSRQGSHTEHARAARVESPVTFVYRGKTALYVIGGATGRQYRFSGPGAALAVDARDAPGFAAVPMLSKRRGTGPW